ncbi:MAG TPA: DUF58 domain-containing protein [Rhodospirillales bacterium]|nr:DUF58 domain-containing protein [Rhodospirillales bacterium]
MKATGLAERLRRERQLSETAGTAALADAEALAAPLPALLVAAERVAATVSQGVHGRRRVGQGETFWQFRRYQPGDATQQIDWRQSAKSQRVFIRQTEWEAAQSVWLWRDASASMAWRSRPELSWKGERADLLLLALASLLVRGGEHLALLGGGDGPAAGRPALHRLLASLERFRERQGTEAASAPPSEPLPRFARLVLFSDFLLPLDTLAGTIRHYAQRGVRGHLVQLIDPAEEILPFSGRVRFEGLENEGEVLFGRVESVREAYVGAIAAHRRGLSALAASVDWTFAVHHTDQPPEPALLALFAALSTGGR